MKKMDSLMRNLALASVGERRVAMAMIYVRSLMVPKCCWKQDGYWVEQWIIDKGLRTCCLIIDVLLFHPELRQLF